MVSNGWKKMAWISERGSWKYIKKYILSHKVTKQFREDESNWIGIDGVKGKPEKTRY